MTHKNNRLRIARPTNRLDIIAPMYCKGLDFDVLGHFKDHQGFDGVIVGHPNHAYHLEFTHHRGTTVPDAPTADNLLVFYISDETEWRAACTKMELAGFLVVVSYNPYWDQHGKTFADLDGYRVVLQNTDWDR
ncbi:VOC family protein [Hafnia alvei]|uniref:VOC family protein n=1 Tax=Hafnia alvei TaxID=569 RepID=UPI0010331C46|nr:VOC family protein [Hafnia alvei]TBL37450.1 VOC family protein [Hafnia alvei]